MKLDCTQSCYTNMDTILGTNECPCYGGVFIGEAEFKLACLASGIVGAREIKFPPKL